MVSTRHLSLITRYPTVRREVIACIYDVSKEELKEQGKLPLIPEEEAKKAYPTPVQAIS